MESGLARRVTPAQGAGELLRAWRSRRRLSQLALALDAGISARHLSFVETGRARPSAELLLALAELTVELFYPADEATAAALRSAATR